MLHYNEIYTLEIQYKSRKKPKKDIVFFQHANTPSRTKLKNNFLCICAVCKDNNCSMSTNLKQTNTCIKVLQTRLLKKCSLKMVLFG